MVIFGMLYLAAMEYFFFDEFNARFNLVAVDYLIYPTETLGNIRDTYPLGAISSGLIALTLLTAWALWRWLKPEPENVAPGFARRSGIRSEEHTSELQSLMRISYAVFCLKKKKTQSQHSVTRKHQ